MDFHRKNLTTEHTEDTEASQAKKVVAGRTVVTGIDNSQASWCDAVVVAG